MAFGITAISQDAIAALGTPTTFAQVTGLNLTSAIGASQVDPDVIPVGQVLNTAVNAVGITAGGIHLPIGNPMFTSTGTVSFTISGSVQLTGNAITATLGNGTASIDIDANVTGINMNLTLDSVEAKLNTPGDAQSLPLTVSVGTVGSLAWSEVSTDVTNTWVEVDIAA